MSCARTNSSNKTFTVSAACGRRVTRREPIGNSARCVPPRHPSVSPVRPQVMASPACLVSPSPWSGQRPSRRGMQATAGRRDDRSPDASPDVEEQHGRRASRHGPNGQRRRDVQDVNDARSLANRRSELTSKPTFEPIRTPAKARYRPAASTVTCWSSPKPNAPHTFRSDGLPRVHARSTSSGSRRTEGVAGGSVRPCCDL